MIPVRRRAATATTDIERATRGATDMRFLLAVARGEAGRYDAVGGDVDRLLERARRHGLWPHAVRGLLDHNAAELGGDVRRRLQRESAMAALRARMLSLRLAELAEAFAGAGIPLLAYKGPVLAALTGRDATLRQSDDLDLVVPAHRRTDALGLLAEHGFQPLHADEPERSAPYHVELIDARDIVVELHWALAGWDRPVRLDLERAAAHAEVVTIHDVGVPTFEREDQLLVLAFHAAKHDFRRLSWLADLAALGSDGLDVHRCEIRARALGVRRALLVALALVERLFDVPPPPALRRGIERRDVAALAATFERRLRVDEQADPRALVRTSVAMGDGPLDRLRLLWWWALPDRRHLVHYPKPLRPVAPLLHPLRQVGRALGLLPAVGDPRHPDR